jgi:valyl-tRNA synthetase
VIAPWPAFPEDWKDAAMETRMALMQELVRVVREVRNRYQIDARTPLDVNVRCPENTADDLRALAPFITSLAGVGRLECGPTTAKPRQSATHVHPQFESYVSLAGLIDPAAEMKRLEKELAEKLKHLQAARGKLGNSNFVDKAPVEVVQQQRDLVEDLQKQVRAVEENLRELRDG